MLVKPNFAERILSAAPALALLALITLITPAPVRAQTKNTTDAATPNPPKTVRAYHLDQIIEITADTVPITLLDTPATINIITGADLEKSGQRELSGVLFTIPGVLDDGSGGTYFSLRGTRSSMSEGAVITIDGKPLNMGRYDYSAIDDIPLDIVEKIEVIKSPAASRYGVNSARGVINIVTKNGQRSERALEKSVSLDLGSWNSLKAFAAVSGRQERWDYSARFGRDQSDGYRHTDATRTLASAQVGVAITEGLRLDWNFGWNDSWRKNAPGLKYWSLDEYRECDCAPSGNTANAYRVRANESDHRMLSTGIALQYRRQGWTLASAFDFSHFDDIYSSLKPYNNPGNSASQRGQGTYVEDRNEDKANFKVTLSRVFTYGDKLSDTVTAGYDYAHTGWDQVRTYPHAASLSASTQNNIKKNDIDFTRAIHGFFVNNDLKYRRWGLYLGARRDSVGYDIANQMPLSFATTFHKPSWDVAPSFSPTANSNLYFSIGQNYWYPNSYYLTAAMEYDDPDNRPEDLKPEAYRNYEVGFKQRLSERLNYSVAFYRSHVDNKYMPYYNDNGFRGYKHVGRSRQQGIELEASGSPLSWLEYRLGFTWIDAIWDEARARVYVYGASAAADKLESLDISGKKLYRVPDYQYSSSLIFHPLRRLTLSADIHGFGKQYIDAYNRYPDKAVHLVDLKASYALTRSLELYMLGSNVFDVKYESIFNTDGARDSGGHPDHDYYPKDGRYVQGGIRLRF